MRQGSSRSTLEIYSQARTADKKAAQQRVVQMVFPEDLNSEIREPDTEHPNIAFDWSHEGRQRLDRFISPRLYFAKLKRADSLRGHQ